MTLSLLLLLLLLYYLYGLRIYSEDIKIHVIVTFTENRTVPYGIVLL
jgi:hypothetical protein